MIGGCARRRMLRDRTDLTPEQEKVLREVIDSEPADLWSFEPPSLGLFPPLEYRLAPVIDTDRALRRRTPLRAVRREFRKKVGELGVPTVLPRQPLDIISVAPSAGFADNGEDRDADFGQDQRAIAGHGGEQSTGERRGNATSCSHHYADLWSGRRDPERLRKNYRRPRCMTPRPRAPQEGVNDDNSWDRRDWQCRFSRVWTQAQPGPRGVFSPSARSCLSAPWSSIGERRCVRQTLERR